MEKKNFRRPTSHQFLWYMEISVAGVRFRRENAVTLAEISSTGDI